MVHTPRGRRILGNPSGPTIITVSGHLGPNAAAAAAAQRYESMLYHSMEEPVDSVSASVRSAGPQAGGVNSGVNSGVVLSSDVLFDEAVDLEPIDFEHFVDEPDVGRNQSERMFQVKSW